MMSIWDELPDRIASVKPTLGRRDCLFSFKSLLSPAYSSNEHGVSLTTFFNRVDKYEPSIMVIRNTNKEVGLFLHRNFYVCLFLAVLFYPVLLCCTIFTISRYSVLTALHLGGRGTSRMIKVGQFHF